MEILTWLEHKLTNYENYEEYKTIQRDKSKVYNLRDATSQNA